MRLAVVVAAALLLTGCAQPQATLPDGVTVSVFQNRFDRGEHQLEIRVSNDTDAAITVSAATFDSTRFQTPAVWDRPQQVPAGSARDLRVQLGEPRCDDAAPRDDVVLDFILDDGSNGTARVTLSEVATIDQVNDKDCLGSSVAAVATIVAAEELLWTPGAVKPAVLTISATPTGADGSVTIREARPTVLLGLVDDAGAPVYDQPVNIVVSAGSEVGVIRLLLIPGRCDPHAVAEDRRGTFFPLDVATSDGRFGQLTVPVSDAVRASIYDFFGDYCGLP